MLKENDPVVIYETGEVGYVEKILDGEGDRLMVRIPSSGSWPYPHHVYVDREKVRKAKGKSSSEEPLLQGE
jgi:hypothetical protein